MTDGTWGSDPQEQPVPLIPDGQRQDLALPAIAEEAERIVLASQAAIAREDTDPTLSIFPSLAGSGMASLLVWGNRPADRLALTLLALGCLAMFVIGWLQ